MRNRQVPPPRVILSTGERWLPLRWKKLRIRGSLLSARRPRVQGRRGPGKHSMTSHGFRARSIRCDLLPGELRGCFSSILHRIATTVALRGKRGLRIAVTSIKSMQLGGVRAGRYSGVQSFSSAKVGPRKIPLYAFRKRESRVVSPETRTTSRTDRYSVFLWKL